MEEVLGFLSQPLLASSCIAFKRTTAGYLSYRSECVKKKGVCSTSALVTRGLMPLYMFYDPLPHGCSVSGQFP